MALALSGPLRPSTLALRFDAATHLARSGLIAPYALQDVDQPEVDLTAFHVDSHYLHFDTI